jgi:hypothetical protein
VFERGTDWEGKAKIARILVQEYPSFAEPSREDDLLEAIAELYWDGNGVTLSPEENSTIKMMMAREAVRSGAFLGVNWGRA